MEHLDDVVEFGVLVLADLRLFRDEFNSWHDPPLSSRPPLARGTGPVRYLSTECLSAMLAAEVPGCPTRLRAVL
jgi:hypothetical protein